LAFSPLQVRRFAELSAKVVVQIATKEKGGHVSNQKQVAKQQASHKS
jgi:hypothetical protein